MLQKDIDEAHLQAEQAELKAEKALKDADEYADTVTNLQALLKIERVEHARDLKKIQTLAPDQVVLAHHFHLEVDSTEVWLNSFGVQFTLDAAKANLTKLEDYQFAIKTEIPKR